MDFEEFKKDFERFTKIDSPGKLEVCMRQYERFVLRKDNQDHFEPFNEEFIEGKFPEQYEINLRKMLVPEDLNEEQLIFLVKPSFEPEYSLDIQNNNNAYLARLRYTTENYWYRYYEDNSRSTSKMQVIEYEIIKEIGDELFKLSDVIFSEAKTPINDSWILDGVQYFFTRKINGEIKTIFKHSPDETYKAGKVVKIFEELCVKLKGNTENI